MFKNDVYLPSHWAKISTEAREERKGEENKTISLITVSCFFFFAVHFFVVYKQTDHEAYNFSLTNM